MPIKLLQFAVLFFFIYASGLQNKCTKDPRSPAQPWAILHLLSVTEPAFPKETFDPINPSLTFGWDFWTSGIHKGLLESSAMSAVYRQIHCTQPTPRTWACPGAVDLLSSLCWADYSWEWAELTYLKSTALMVHMLTICVVCGSETWPFPLIFDQWLCLIKRNFTPWHSPASLRCRGRGGMIRTVMKTETEQILIWNTKREKAIYSRSTK